MSYTPSQTIRSMFRVTWDQAGYFVWELFKSFGLGLTGCKPFLLRPVRARLASDLARFEPLVRRLLYIMAVECGPLSARKATRVEPIKAKRPTATSRLPNYLRTPRFRIAEPIAGACNVRPPLRLPASGPRIRFLDMPLPPPGPYDYPPKPTDLVPARPLVQRLRALQDVFDNPAFYIKAMRRRLVNPKPPLRRQLPPGLRARTLSPLERDTVETLHLETMTLSDFSNTS